MSRGGVLNRPGLKWSLLLALLPAPWLVHGCGSGSGSTVPYPPRVRLAEPVPWPGQPVFTWAAGGKKSPGGQYASAAGDTAVISTIPHSADATKSLSDCHTLPPISGVISALVTGSTFALGPVSHRPQSRNNIEMVSLSPSGDR